MAMVGNSPANQAASRTWTTQTSSSPTDSDDSLAHPIQANLHGVIGEHRRSSRSSSVSSGGSSGNNAESTNENNPRPVTQTRLQQVVSQPDQQAAALEQQTHQLLQQFDSDKKDTAGQDVNQFHSIQAPVEVTHNSNGISCSTPSSTELVSQLNLIPASACNDDADPMQLGFMMGQRSGRPSATSQPGFQQPAAPSRQGRRITGSGSFPSTSIPGSETELCRLIGDSLTVSTFPTSDMIPQMDFQSSQDIFSSSNDQSLVAHASPLTAHAGSLGQSYPQQAGSKGYQPNGAGFGYGGSGQQFYGQGSGSQFQSMPAYYNGSQVANPMSSNSNGYYSNQANYNGASPSSYYTGGSAAANGNGRQNAYYPNQSPNMQGYNSQDFSLPPPAQPWQANGFNSPGIPEMVVQRMTCERCHKVHKWPHALECLHVYCFACLVQVTDRSTMSVICPKCSHETAVPDGPCYLTLDYQLCGLMVKYKVSPFTCTLCTRDQEASFCCVTCSAYLCLECYERHKHMLHFQGHTVNAVSKIGKHGGDYKPMCPKHSSEPETKYCVACELMICDQCMVDHAHPNTPSSNNNHNMQEAYNIILPRLQSWNEDACIKYKDVLDVMRRFPDLKQVLDIKKRNVKRQVDEYADYIKNVVDQNRAAAMDTVEQAHVQMESHVNSMVKIYSDLAKGLEGMSTFNTRTVDEGIMPDVMKNLTIMEACYKRLISRFSDVVKTSEGITCEFKFSPNYPSTNELIHDNFNAISYKINEKDYNVVPMTITPRGDSRSRNYLDYAGSSDNPDCNYQRWSSATESMPISTWNNGNERDRKSGTFIPPINRCRVRTSYTHLFGEYGRGDYAFTEPSGQAYLNDGSYVICDTNNHRIVYYNANHEFVRSIGQPPNLPPLADEQEQRSSGVRNKGFQRQDGYLYFPNRVAICPVSQHIVATERPPSHDIQIFSVEGEFKRCFGGNILQHPRGVTVDEKGVIIVVECKVMKLVMFDTDGSFLVSHSLTKDLEFPNDVAARDAKIYISDNRGHCVQVFNYDAEFLYKIGFESVTYFPIGVSINYLNQVVVTDNHNTFNITVFDLSGKVLHIFESITKHAQCHNVAVHPTSLELMLTTKDCNVYFFNYDPNAQHPPPTAPTRASGHPFNSRRTRGNGNSNSGSSSYY